MGSVPRLGLFFTFIFYFLGYQMQSVKLITHLSSKPTIIIFCDDTRRPIFIFCVIYMCVLFFPFIQMPTPILYLLYCGCPQNFPFFCFLSYVSFFSFTSFSFFFSVYFHDSFTSLLHMWLFQNWVLGKRPWYFAIFSETEGEKTLISMKIATQFPYFDPEIDVVLLPKDRIFFLKCVFRHV